MGNTTSLTLLERLARGGDNDDWQRLLEIYKPFIKQRVSTYPDLLDQIEDITQDVVMVMMRELPTFQRQRVGSFRTFLKNITLNQLRNAARKTRRQPRPQGGGPELEQLIESLADPISIESANWDIAHDSAVFNKVKDYIQGDYSETTWRAFELHGIEGIPAKKVADMLGTSPNVVMLARSRILKRMRKEAEGLIER
jgi:RNA polymerase sigma-70 factor, ECF subfamily